jgi:hypothetical protein
MAVVQCKVAKIGTNLWRYKRNPRASGIQQARLAKCDRTATDNQAGTIVEIQECRKVVHDAARSKKVSHYIDAAQHSKDGLFLPI